LRGRAASTSSAPSAAPKGYGEGGPPAGKGLPGAIPAEVFGRDRGASSQVGRSDHAALPRPGGDGAHGGDVRADQFGGGDGARQHGVRDDQRVRCADEITVSAADALGAIEWEEPTAAGPLASIPAAGWRGSAVSVAVGSVAGASGGGATAEASAVQIRLARGYRGLPITLAWLDELGGSGSLPIPTNGDWSDWLSVSGEDNSIVSAKIKVGRYI